MARKIIISFDSLPVLGDAFSYNILIGATKLIYNSGLDTVDTYFKSQLTDPLPPNSIQLRNSIEDTIAETIFTLTTYYNNSNLIYKVIGTTIEIIINADLATVEYLKPSNPSITITDEVIITTSKLKYFLEYKNIIGDLYRCQISQKDYTGEASQVYGNIVIDKGSVKDHLDPIRGTGLSLQLEASKNVTLEDLYTQDEQEFTVKLYKNNKVYFVGYLKPDGVYQDFTRDEWRLNLDCVDGLGALKSLSFVDSEGYQLLGKRSASEIVFNCLKRSGILLNINTSVNTHYEGLIPSNNLDVLTKTFLNADRFVRKDNNTIMSCEDVLKSVLDIFCAVITQKEGEWYIYKPNELFLNSNPLFRRYDITNTFIGTKNVNLNSVLGSQINNFYPHHSGGNQRIEIKGGVSAFRVGYKYGFVSGLLPNASLQHNGNLIYDNWTVIDGTNLVNDPTRTSGFIIKNTLTGSTTLMVKSDNLGVVAGDFLSLKINYTTSGLSGSANAGGRFIRMRIQNGLNYLNYIPKNDLTPLQEAADLAVWSTDANSVYSIYLNGTGSLDVAFPRILTTGSLSLAIIQTFPSKGLTTINNMDIIPNLGAKPEQGEFHTVQRKSKISSIVKENKEVFNGDNIGLVYVGALFKEDKITLTSLWSRRGVVENKSILRIAAEEELRISQKPLKIFSGNIYGYLDYLTICDIKNVYTKFMPLEWSYDTIKNTTNVKFLELYVAEISDIDYTFTYDFGETVKPTITG